MTKEIKNILKKDLKKYETLVNITEGEAQEIYMEVVMFFQELINELNDREKRIIILRYYKGKTQSEVAEKLGITQVQVSRIEKKILLDMRRKIS